MVERRNNMNRYDNKIKDVQERAIQQDLHTKYDIEDSDVIIKETTNMSKFLIKNIKGLLKLCFDVLITLLAAIGILSLVYENIRVELFEVLDEALRIF